MARGILLDSSVVIPHLRGQLDLAALVPAAESLFLPLTALGELYKGFLKSNSPEKNRILLEIFLRTVAVVNPDSATAWRYGQINADLERKGTLIPQNDVWIAAVALECDMPLVTRDVHFQHVANLQLLSW